MSSDQNANLIFALLAIALVGSGLAARRLPLKSAVKMAFAWVAIFGIVFIFIAFWDDLRIVGRRLMWAANPETGVVAGETLRIPMASDGHFWVRGTVNGAEARFLIDSGATTTALSARTLDEANIEPAGGFPAVIETAGGPVSAKRVRIERLSVGPIARTDFAAITAPEFGDTNVLGMNFLSTLNGWGVEGKTLILRP